MMSPASTQTAGSPTMAAQQPPDVSTWYSMTWSAPGITRGASWSAGGASATQGVDALMA
jgi:hypothetical protein